MGGALLPFNIDKLSNAELIEVYGGAIIKKLKDRKVIRSKNLVGDLGEYLAIDYYCRTPGLPKLQSAPAGTKNIDAISIHGDRYSIKTTTGAVTGVFYGLNSSESNEKDTQKFEYLVLVMLDDNMKLKRINELDWTQFLQYKRWHSRMKAWNIAITRELLNSTRTIFASDQTSATLN